MMDYDDYSAGVGEAGLTWGTLGVKLVGRLTGVQDRQEGAGGKGKNRAVRGRTHSTEHGVWGLTGLGVNGKESKQIWRFQSQVTKRICEAARRWEREIVMGSLLLHDRELLGLKTLRGMEEDFEQNFLWNWCKMRNGGASLVAQWLRVCLPMQETRVQALVWEDPTCRGATRPVSHNYWACVSGACAPQRERPRQWEARAPRWRVAPACHN